MSLYNMVCGNNPTYQLLHAVLATAGPLPEIPRYRDTYTMKNGDGVVQIVIYTRTGGGNRDGYEAENEDLAAHPLYVTDRDDDFDSTFAHFVYRVPDEWQDRIGKVHDLLSKHPKGRSPRDKFSAAMAALGDSEAPAEATITDSEIDALGSLLQEVAVELGLARRDQP